MSILEVLKFRIGDSEVVFRWTIVVTRQLTPELRGADAGSILIARAMGIKSLVGDGQREFPLLSRFAHAKGVFADEGFSLESDVLDEDVVVHMAPEPR